MRILQRRELGVMWNRASVSHYTHKAFVLSGLERSRSWRRVRERDCLLWSSCCSARQQSVNHGLSNQTAIRWPVIPGSAMRVLSQVDLFWPVSWPLYPRYVTLARARQPPTLPLVLRPGDIEHLIKHTLSGSNVTVLSRSQSIPLWPFSVFNFVGYQAWRCSRIEGIQRSRAVRGGGGGGGLHRSHVKHWKPAWTWNSRPVSASNSPTIIQSDSVRFIWIKPE